MDPSRHAVIGVDSGNTKTAGICCTLDGRLVAHAVHGPSNYQNIGAHGAGEVLLAVTLPLAEAARDAGLTLAGFGFGLTGLDRPRDAEKLDPLTIRVVERLSEVAPMLPKAVRDIRNDAYLVLRAGTDDGVGVAVLSGTGGNCVGIARGGQRIQIGGFAGELGDGGGAGYIALEGLKAAGKARDGRGWKTSITERVTGFLNLPSIVDIMDFAIPGNQPPGYEEATPPQVGMLAPFVFDAAADGDLVALRILMDVGRELGVSARVAATRLGFGPDDPFPLVLGGGVLTNATDPTFARAIILEVQTQFPRATPFVLDCPPVVGAALLALDAIGVSWPGTDEGEIRRRLGAAAREALS
jgi:N-acetylglucosamine kinase-like BadF-type ATPase